MRGKKQQLWTVYDQRLRAFTFSCFDLKTLNMQKTWTGSFVSRVTLSLFTPLNNINGQPLSNKPLFMMHLWCLMYLIQYVLCHFHLNTFQSFACNQAGPLVGFQGHLRTVLWGARRTGCVYVQTVFFVLWKPCISKKPSTFNNSLVLIFVTMHFSGHQLGFVA